jgi:hypothetical protein
MKAKATFVPVIKSQDTKTKSAKIYIYIYIHAFFISALHRAERQLQTLADLSPTESPWTEADVDNRPGQDAVDEIIYSSSESNPDSSVDGVFACSLH